MSFHFLNGNSYGAYADNGPGSIIVDPLATIQANGAAALTLQSGPWTMNINGKIEATGAVGIYLSSSGTVSTVKLGAQASVLSTDTTGILLNEAANVINQGKITGRDYGLEIGGLSDRDYGIKNLKTGVISGVDSALAVYGSGIHAIANAGSIQYSDKGAGYAITGEEGTEKVTNWGDVHGHVSLGAGNDVFTNFKKIGNHFKQGTVNGVIDLGAGNDRFNGGNRAEFVRDGDGKDIVKLGGGNDTWQGYLAGGNDVAETIDGGKGIDTYDASQAGTDLIAVNLGGDFILFPAHTALTFFSGIEYGETISGFENVIGSAGQDVLIGSAGRNTFEGGDGEDLLAGRGGADSLFGGADADTFYFVSLKDSGPKAATRDTIHDFEIGVDQISLEFLNTQLGNTIDDFLGVDVAFTGNKGDLRAVTSGDNTIVQLDVNGDKKADFSIQLDGHIALTGGDFIFQD
jgi:Ca2+-binding RTX toxin-like protein